MRLFFSASIENWFEDDLNFEKIIASIIASA